jgi:uncharacterized protein YecT (DUF1311 family)
MSMGNRMRSSAIVLALLSLPVSILGQESCMERAATTVDMQRCADQTVQTLDSLLVSLENQIQDRLPPDSPESSAIWREYRLQQCEFEAAFFAGGSIQPVVYTTCYGSLTADRIRRLAIFLCDGAGVAGECAESQGYLELLSDLGQASR